MTSQKSKKLKRAAKRAAFKEAKSSIGTDNVSKVWDFKEKYPNVRADRYLKLFKKKLGR